MSRLVATALMIAAIASQAGCDDMTKQDRTDRWTKPTTKATEKPPGLVAFDDQPEAVPPLTPALIVRGQERYRIYCAPCHSETGDGNGMIVQRGFPRPPSYHLDRLRSAPTQHFYDVITNGYGAMYSFAARVPPPDRWAIAAYIRALQRSQNASIAGVSAEQRADLP